MKIGEIIKQKRQEQNLTQEQVADYLGVSGPAVSKWESAASYPDITLLPALARLLDTDLNTLLDFRDDLSEREVTAFINELSQVLISQSFAAGLTLARAKLKEFPNCPLLLLQCGLTLQGMSLMAGADISPQEKAEIIGYLERAAASREQRVSQQACSALVNIRLEEGNTEAAEKILQAMPEPIFNDKRRQEIKLLKHKQEYEAAMKKAVSYFLSMLMEIYPLLLTMQELTLEQGKPAEAERLAEKASEFARCAGLGVYYRSLPQLTYYAATKNKEELLPLLRELLGQLKEMKIFSDQAFDQYLNHKKQAPGEQDLLPGIMKKTLLEAPELNFIRGDAAFQELLTEYPDVPAGLK